MLDVARKQLSAAGFVEEASGSMSHMSVQFTRPIKDSSLKIGATWSKAGGEHVDLALEVSKRQPAVGTVHRVLSAARLPTEIPNIVSALERLAGTPDLLKCPKCQTRYVHLEERPGEKFKPFLSCAGMQIVTKRFEGQPFKALACRGTSKKIEPLLLYR